MERHVRTFNHGVRTGDWEPMLKHFAQDAELQFENVPAGPFGGLDAIRTAYREQPPDDEIVLLDGGPRYAWAREPARPAGEIHLTERDGVVTGIRVLYERFSDA